MARHPNSTPAAGDKVARVTSPNILLIMTDEERYPPPLRDGSGGRVPSHAVAIPRAASETADWNFIAITRAPTACVPSRATLFTGQYPSLHGVSKTDGIAKTEHRSGYGLVGSRRGPRTLGDWFRAGGYQTHYRGKWHISHANLEIPGGHEGLKASDDRRSGRFPRELRRIARPIG